MNKKEIKNVALGFVVDQVADAAFNHATEPAKIAADAAKDILFSDKSAAEIGKNVEDASLKAVVVLGTTSAILGVAATGGTLMAIPIAIGASYMVAKSVSPIYGGIAWGVAKIFKKN